MHYDKKATLLAAGKCWQGQEFEMVVEWADDGVGVQRAGFTVIYANPALAKSDADRWRAKGATVTVTPRSGR